MTANQIAYYNAVENARANRVNEEETHRSNVRKEDETNRANVAQEILKNRDLFLKGRELDSKYGTSRRTDTLGGTETWKTIGSIIKGIGSIIPG